MDITFFEIHLDGAQFGPKTIGSAMKGEWTGEETATDEMDEFDEISASESSRRSRSPPRFLPVVLLVGVAVGYAAYRRFRGDGDGDGGESIDAGAEAVEIEA